jgi:hypothetical protein
MLSIHFDTDKRMVCFCKLKALCPKISSLSIDFNFYMCSGFNSTWNAGLPRNVTFSLSWASLLIR